MNDDEKEKNYQKSLSMRQFDNSVTMQKKTKHFTLTTNL